MREIGGRVERRVRQNKKLRAALMQSFDESIRAGNHFIPAHDQRRPCQ